MSLVSLKMQEDESIAQWLQSLQYFLYMSLKGQCGTTLSKDPFSERIFPTLQKILFYFALLQPRNLRPLKATWFKVAYEYTGDTNPPSHSVCHLKDGTQRAGTEIVTQRKVLQHLLPVLEPFPQHIQPSETTVLLPDTAVPSGWRQSPESSAS